MVNANNPQFNPQDVNRSTDENINSIADKLQAELTRNTKVTLQSLQERIEKNLTVQTKDQGQIGKLRVRDDNGNIISRIGSGDNVTFLDETKTTKDKSGQNGKETQHIWFKVQYSDNENDIGWVSAEYLTGKLKEKVVPEPAPAQVSKSLSTQECSDGDCVDGPSPVQDRTSVMVDGPPPGSVTGENESSSPISLQEDVVMPHISRANTGLQEKKRVLGGLGGAVGEVSADRMRADMSAMLSIEDLDNLDDKTKQEFLSYYSSIMSSPEHMDLFLSGMDETELAENLRQNMINNIISAEYFSLFETYLMGMENTFSGDEIMEITTALVVIASTKGLKLSGAITEFKALNENDLNNILKNSGRFSQSERVTKNLIAKKTQIVKSFNNFKNSYSEIDNSQISTLSNLSEEVNRIKFIMARSIRDKANENIWKKDDKKLDLAEGLYTEYIYKELAKTKGIDNKGRIFFSEKLKEKIAKKYKKIEAVFTDDFILKSLKSNGVRLPSDKAKLNDFIQRTKSVTLSQKYNELAIKEFVDQNDYSDLSSDVQNALSDYDDMLGINWIHDGAINFADKTLDAETIGKEIAINGALIATTGGLGIAGGLMAEGAMMATRLGARATLAGIASRRGAYMVGNMIGGNLGMAGASKVAYGADFWKTALDWRLAMANGMSLGLGRYMVAGKGGLLRKAATVTAGGYGVSGISTGEWDLSNPEVMGNTLFNAVLASFGAKFKTRANRLSTTTQTKITPYLATAKNKVTGALNSVKNVDKLKYLNPYPYIKKFFPKKSTNQSTTSSSRIKQLLDPKTPLPILRRLNKILKSVDMLDSDGASATRNLDSFKKNSRVLVETNPNSSFKVDLPNGKKMKFKLDGQENLKVDGRDITKGASADIHIPGTRFQFRIKNYGEYGVKIQKIEIDSTKISEGIKLKVGETGIIRIPVGWSKSIRKANEKATIEGSNFSMKNGAIIVETQGGGTVTINKGTKIDSVTLKNGTEVRIDNTLSKRRTFEMEVLSTAKKSGRKIPKESTKRTSKGPS